MTVFTKNLQKVRNVVTLTRFFWCDTIIKENKKEGYEMKNILGFVISIVYIGLIIVSGKLFEKRSKEASRKFIHIMLAPYWIIAILCFDNVIAASVMPFLFVIINFLSCKFNIIKQMERDDEEKDGYGTVYYALSLLILSILTYGPLKIKTDIYGPIVALTGVLVMALGDGFAAIIGKKVKSFEYKIGKTKKTLAGSATMFAITLVIISIFLAYFKIPMWFLKAMIISIISTILEAVAIKGLDNILVPVLTTLMVFLVI